MSDLTSVTHCVVASSPFLSFLSCSSLSRARRNYLHQTQRHDGDRNQQMMRIAVGEVVVDQIGTVGIVKDQRLQL